MDTEYVLAQFSRKRNAALRDYRRLVEEGMGMGRIPEFMGGGLVRSLGGWSQVLFLRRRGRGKNRTSVFLAVGILSRPFCKRLRSANCVSSDCVERV
jgi:hypothetical protein